MGIARKFIVAGGLSLSLFSPWTASRAQEGGDVQAQILYSYQTEDINSLASLVQTLSLQQKTDSRDAALRYHLAHAQYRMGELLEARQKHRAEAALSDCIDETQPLVEKMLKYDPDAKPDPDTKPDLHTAEALALQSACYDRLAGLRFIESPLLRSRALERIKEALEVAPRSPRVLFIAATEGLERAKPNSAEHQREFERLNLAAKLFDESSATGIDLPGWGHAEAYLALGRELQARGDHLGARNWIEKSLIAAPDFKAAQRQLAGLAHP